MSTSLNYELQCWVQGFLRFVPGRVGCALRRLVYPCKMGVSSYLWDGAYIDRASRLVIGDRVSINRGVCINAEGGVTIGDDVLIGPGVTIYTQSHRYKGSEPIAMQGYDVAPVVLERGCWIAANAIVLPGVTVGSGAVVAAGAVVTRSVRARSIVAGVPAREIGAF